MFIAWCMFCYVIPILGVAVGKHLSNIPSWNEIEQLNSEIKIEHNEERKAYRELNIPGESRLDRWKRYQNDLKKNIYFFLDRFRRQGHLANLISMISPAHLFQVISEHITGTSVEDYQTFMDRARYELISYWDLVMTYSYFEKTRYEINRMHLERNASMLAASQSYNRLTIRKSLSGMVVLLFPIVVLNIILFFMIIMCYENKSIII